MNPRIELLKTYPFVRLATLKSGCLPPPDLPHIAMSIGEPRHEPPSFVVDALTAAAHDLGSYPTASGLPELRRAIAQWLHRRYGLGTAGPDPETMILPVNGTREGLFAFTQAVVDNTTDVVVAMPNPFYQIYEGAALLAGATPYYMNTDRSNGFLPDFDSVPESIWKRCQLLFLCSPGNPTGAVADATFFEQVLTLADRYDFIVASDECYAEIYSDEQRPPVGLLEVCKQLGRDDFSRCVVFHSLSKRSNVPGLRSGFVAGDASLMRGFLDYRMYHGCAMPEPTQHASIAAWKDDAHVEENRRLYRQKFDRVLEILTPALDVERPEGAFYLWPQTPIDDEAFAKQLYATENLTTLPGRYLARETPAGNPGVGRLRISLVASVDECTEAARRIRRFVESF